MRSGSVTPVTPKNGKIFSEFNNLIESLRGFLKKKSPKVAFLYQKRFFMVSEDGSKLVYFENEKSNSNPKGVLTIDDILDLRTISNVEFEIKYPDRKFQLSAETPMEKNKWFDGINKLREHNLKEDREFSRSKGVSVAHWKDVDKMTAQQLQKEKEELVSQLNIQKDSDLSQKILEVKKLRDYLNLIDTEILSKRVIYGFLSKKGKMNNVGLQIAGIGVKVNIQEKKRWCFLISNKSIDEEAEPDNIILHNDVLPTWINFNTIYYFSWDSQTDSSGPKGNIPLSECLEIIVDSAQNYILRINMGERIFKFNAKSEEQRQKWAKSIRMAMKNEGAENIGNKKCIDRAIDIYDSTSIPEDQRINQLKEYLNAEFKKLNIQEFQESENFEFLVKTRFDPILCELIEISKTAFSKDPPRIDILNYYINLMHIEKFTDEINWFWTTNCYKIGNPDFLFIANTLFSYKQKSQEYFIDERIDESIRLLTDIYFNAITESIMEIVPNIISQLEKCEPEPNENGLLTTNLPIDLYKLLHETFHISIKGLNHSEVYKRFSRCAVVIITNSQYKLGKLIEEVQLDCKQLIAICNDTVGMIKMGKELGQKIKNEEKIESLGRNWVRVGSVAKDKLLSILFKNISYFFKLEYKCIEVVEICEEMIENFKVTVSLIHDSYYRKVWQGLLEVIIIEYLKSLIICCKKRSMNTDNLLIKLNKDIEKVNELFTDLIFASIVKEKMKPLSQILRLLNCQLFLSFIQHIERLHKTVKWNNNAYKTLIKFRKDLPSSMRKEIIKLIPSILNQLDNDEGEEFNLENLLLEKKSQESESDQEEEEDVVAELTEETESEDSDVEENNDDKANLGKKNSCKENEKINIFKGEGYLLKKPPNPFKTFWEKRYFRYRNGVLYWYKDQSSNQAQNKIIIKDIEDTYAHPGNPKVFMIQMNDRLFNLQTDKHSTRDLWVVFLKEEMEKSQKSMTEVQKENRKIEPIILKSRNLPVIITPITFNREAKTKKKIYEAPERRQTIRIDFSIEDEDDGDGNDKKQNRTDSFGGKFLNLFK